MRHRIPGIGQERQEDPFHLLWVGPQHGYPRLQIDLNLDGVEVGCELTHNLGDDVIQIDGLQLVAPASGKAN